MGIAFMAEGLELGEQVGAADGEAAADAGHAVDLRKGAEDDDVFVGGDHVEDRG